MTIEEKAKIVADYLMSEGWGIADEDIVCTCDSCSDFFNNTDFCPNCGAKNTRVEERREEETLKGLKEIEGALTLLEQKIQEESS